MAVQLYQNSVQAFLRESVKSGEIHLLVSGTLSGLATPSGSGYTWSTGSWHKYGVNAAGDWTGSMAGATPNTGTLQAGSYLVGLAVSAYVSGSGDKAINALERSQRLKMKVSIGNTSQDLDLAVQSKELRDGFIYIQVEPVQLPSTLFGIYFKYNSGNYRGYTCYPTGGLATETVISLFPYTPPVESEEYNPTLNNAIEDTKGTIARLVEPFEESSSMGILRFEKATTYASIPDSFYSSIANISSRWLGTKNAEYHIYLGEKLDFTEENIKECEQDIQQNADKGICLVYQGSPYILQTGNQTITTDLIGNLKGTVEPGSRLVGDNLQGTISGSFSGSVTDINLVRQNITYYSSSVNAVDHTIWSQDSNIKGTGTFFYNNWGRSTNGNDFAVSGSNSSLQGLTRLTGQFLSSEYTASVQDLKIDFLNTSGSITTQGTITGFGSMNYTASQQVAEAQESSTALAASMAALKYPAALDTTAAQDLSWISRQTSKYTDLKNYLQLKNAQISKLVVDNVTYGDLKIVSAETTYISGTVGNAAGTFTLHKFTGHLEADNNVSQNISFEHADADGVVLSNVEVVEQATTIFDSFTANSITTVQDFSGRAGFALTEGNINVASDGVMYVSLTTEDQEDITGSGATGSDAELASDTGSLPSAVDVFMEKASGDYGEWLVPNWDFSTVRKNIVGDIINGVIRERDVLAKGTALVSGSFLDFEVQATRKSLRLYRSLHISGSHVRQADVLQATRMLSNLEAGLTFARQAYLRPDTSVETSSVTPRIVSKAIMPQRVYDAMITASGYVIPDTDGNPVWKLSGSLPSGGLDRNFDFYATGSATKQQLQSFMTGSKEAIGRLNTFLSSSVLDTYAKKQSGQYTYVYLSSVGSDFLKADIRSFSGSYIDLTNDTIHHTSGFQALSGSFRQIWGKFGEGTIVKGQSLKSLDDLSLEPLAADRWPVSSMSPKRKISGIHGVVYGAFDFRGYVIGGYEGNMVEGTIEGDLAGVISGQVSTGSIEGGPVQLIGTNRGTFTSTVRAGSFEGAMKNLSITSNNLVNNLYFEGLVEGIEEFPLEGVLSGSVKSVILPGQCDYEVTASAILSGQPGVLRTGTSSLEVSIPLEGQMSGQIYSSGSGPLLVNLTGENIDTSASFAGTFSASVTFGDNGKISTQGRVDIPTGGGWVVQTAVSESKLSGQFEIAGISEVTTPEDHPFTGKISTVSVDQAVSGSFDIAVQTSTFVDMNMTGSLEDFTGHALARGLLNIESGTNGNLVEGHDRPFFTLQSFSGSVFPEDTTLEAVQNMNISDMVIENLGFTSGMALLHYSSGSFGKVKEQEYVQNTLTLPQVGDIVYTSTGGRSRVVSSKVYCPDLNALLTVNDHGTVVSEVNLAQIQ